MRQKDSSLAERRRTPDSTVPGAITFTGKRSHNHYCVQIEGREVTLTPATLNCLIELVLARGETETGFLQLPALEVFRVRRALDEALGAGAGKNLIETGGGEEYCLTISRAELRHHISVTACFPELVELQVVSAQHCKRLRQMVSS